MDQRQLSSLYEKKEVEKIAGTRLPDDYNQWRSEVLKALVNQHPYIDTSQTKIVFQDVDTEEKTAWGVVIIDNKVAVVFSIRPNKDTGNIELDPLDVMFSDGKFKYLSEDSFKRAIDSQQPGRVYPENTEEEEYGNLPPENEYVGDLTGDVTPLEYSGYPAAYGGPRAMTMASCGVISRVIRDDRDVNRLFNLLSNYDGINAAAEAVGLDDSLENLRSGVEPTPFGSEMAHIFQRDDGQLMVAFKNGETKSLSAIDLKQMFPDNHKNILRKVLGRGWAIVRNFPTAKSVEAPVINTLPSPLEEGGWCRLLRPDGEKVNGVAAMKVVDFDGRNIRKQKVITEDNEYATGKAFLGVRMTEDPDDHPVIESSLDPGKVGCFLNESFDPTMTPNVRIEHVTEMPDEPIQIEAMRPGSGESIGLVVADSIVKPHRIDPRFTSDYDVPTPAYYIPSHMSFVECGPGETELADKGKKNSIQSPDDRAQAKLFKNANLYTISGDTEHGEITLQNMDEKEARTKLARLGADDHAIEKAMDMEDREEMGLYGLRVHDRIKLAEQKSPIEDLPRDLVENQVHIIKEAADAAIEGANAVINQGGRGQEALQDNESLNSLLSLQFVSEETLDELVESLPLFEEVEDRLGKLLMASRQGEDSIHEKGVQRALRGIGEAKKSLRTLAIELESREQGK